MAAIPWVRIDRKVAEEHADIPGSSWARTKGFFKALLQIQEPTSVVIGTGVIKDSNEGLGPCIFLRWGGKLHALSAREAGEVANIMENAVRHAPNDLEMFTNIIMVLRYAAAESTRLFEEDKNETGD